MIRVITFALAVTALASGSVGASEAAPSHVKTWLYYGAVHLNERLPAAYVAAHADFAEADASQADFVNGFKDAGGRYAVMYTDPTFIPHCLPPFAPPAGPCHGPIGNLPLPESAWLHGADGARVHRADDYTHEYQEILNPDSPAARAAYRSFTAQVQKRARVDIFFADDSGSTFRGGDRTPMSGMFYKYNAASVEIEDDPRYIESVKRLLASATRPVIINGNDPATYQPAYEGEFLKAPNVIGENNEGCFVASWYKHPVSEEASRWQRQADALLAITAHHRYAICMMMGDLMADPLARLYGLASWWLTYDPNWSVIAPVSPGSDGLAVFADEDLVPSEPLQSAERSIGALRRPSGTYVREFRMCYERGRAVGGCAAVVNTSEGATLPVPRLTRRYAASLSLSSKSAYGGGSLAWSAAVPSSLGPLQAAILRTAP